MKESLIITFLLFCCLSCEQNSMPDPAVTAEQPVLPAETIPQEHLVALTLDKMNIVYVGIDNPLTLHYNGPDARDLRLIVSPSGKLSGGGQHYLLKVQEPGEVTLKVMSKGRELGQQFPMWYQIEVSETNLALRLLAIG